MWAGGGDGSECNTNNRMTKKNCGGGGGEGGAGGGGCDTNTIMQYQQVR